MSTKTKSTNWGQFIPLVSVFFFWGFVAASNDILIPVFKKAFELSQSESQLVALSFYIAFTVGALIYMGISLAIGRDLLNKIGYKNGLALGLLISAFGTLLFYPAASGGGSFVLMLSGLFIVGLGFSLQQTVANPLAIALGPPSTGSQRLTLAGGINNFGTTIGPLIVSYAIFGSGTSGNTDANIEDVKIPYLALGLAFLIVAILLRLSSLPNHPDVTEEEEDEINTMGSENINVLDTKHTERKNALQYPQLVLGMLAIFVYVGVEVSTASNLPAFMEDILRFETSEVAPYISLYWASLMIGRWSGAVESFGLNTENTRIAKLLMPYLAFGVFLLVNFIAGHDLAPFYVYAAIILVLIGADFASKGNPARMLFIYSCLGAIAITIGMSFGGIVSVYAFTSVGLFCSTLWPCIFTLAISGLKKHTSQGSNFLIMMIMGGGFISILQGFIADITSINTSYIVGILCFGYLAFYAYKVREILLNQNIDLDNLESEGGH